MNKTIQEQIKNGTAYQDACTILGVEPLTRECYNFLPEAEGDYDWAEHQIKRVSDAMNKIDKFKADYRDTNQPKWFPLFWFSGSGWSLDGSLYGHDYAYVGSRLCVSSKAASDYLGELMKAEYAVIMNAQE